MPYVKRLEKEEVIKLSSGIEALQITENSVVACLYT